MGGDAHRFLRISRKKKLCLKSASITRFEIILLFSAQGCHPEAGLRGATIEEL
jgi:hypothetical protein